MDESLRAEAIRYFRTKPVMVICINQIHKKYERLGRFAGTISKSLFKKVDVSPLLAFLGDAPWEWEKRKSVKISEFIRNYEESKFEDIPFETVVEAVTGKKLKTKQELSDEAEEGYASFLKAIAEIHKPFLDFFARMRNGTYFQWFQNEKEDCLEGFRSVANALQNLPADYTKLPVFAHRITGNPHAFDSSGLTGQLLYLMLSNELAAVEQTDPTGEFLSKTELENEVYGSFKIIKDDIMNFTAVNGLLAYRGDTVIPMWQDSCTDRIPWNVPVRQLLEVSRIYPAKGKSIFLIENSGVYSILLDAYPAVPMVCTNGQFRYAVWLLLERISDEGITLYYSGDFDPEGVQMADTLKRRYADKVRFLGMSIENYRLSQPAAAIDDKRLQKLKRIQTPELQPLAKAIMEQKTAGYQEGILDQILSEMKSIRDADRGLPE